MLTVVDLFCCEGGASMGMHYALDAHGVKHRIIGVDIEPRSRYPFEFVQADALKYQLPGEVAFLWASPPCQAYSPTKYMANSTQHKDLVAATRQKLLAADIPYCMENVPQAPLHSSLVLRGNMFNLPLKRDRSFETSFWVPQPNLVRMPGQANKYDYITICGHGGAQEKMNTERINGWPWRGVTLWQAAMEMPWATQTGLAQAVPPMYSWYIMDAFLSLHKELKIAQKQQKGE